MKPGTTRPARRALTRAAHRVVPAHGLSLRRLRRVLTEGDSFLTVEDNALHISRTRAPAYPLTPGLWPQSSVASWVVEEGPRGHNGDLPTRRQIKETCTCSRW
jgi:hypothetical protein